MGFNEKLSLNAVQKYGDDINECIIYIESKQSMNNDQHQSVEHKETKQNDEEKVDLALDHRIGSERNISVLQFILIKICEWVTEILFL